MNTRFSHPFEKWMDSALRNGRDWRHEGERRATGSSSGRRVPSSADHKHHKPHTTLKSSSKHGKGVQKAADRARQSYRSMGSPTRDERYPQSSRDYEESQPRDGRAWMSPSSSGSELWQNSPWAVPPWSTLSGSDNRDSMFPMMDDFMRRMDDFERRIGMLDEDEGSLGRSLIASANDEDHSTDMQEYDKSPLEMMKDYLSKGSEWLAPTKDKAGELDAQWEVKDDGNLMLTMQLPKWMEAKDVQVNLEKGNLRLSGKRDRSERHVMKGTDTKVSAQQMVSFRYEWPLDSALKESDVHAHFDSSEGMLEVSIDVPPNSQLQEALDGYKRDGARGEDWVKIPISSTMDAMERAGIAGTQYREDVKHAEDEGMVEHQKQAAKDVVEGTSSKLEEVGTKAKDMYRDAKDKAGEVVESAKEKASDTMDTAKEKVSDAFQTVTFGAKGSKRDSKKQGSSANDPQAPSLDEM